MGFYTSCEVTTIFLFDKVRKETLNYYTLFSFEEREIENKSPKYLTNKLISISSKYSLGMIQYQLSINEAKDCFQQVCNRTTLTNYAGIMEFGELHLINKEFIPANGTDDVIMNKVLKNNFFNGSYIYEFFDLSKKWKLTLSDSEISYISKCILENVPIDLFVVTDRVANVIFQFPSQILKVQYKTERSESILKFNIKFDKRIDNKDKYCVYVTNHFDNTIVSNAMKEGIHEQLFDINTGDTSNINEIIIYDKTTNLIVFTAVNSFIGQFNFHMNMGSEFGNDRIITDADGKSISRKINSSSFFKTNDKSQRDWKEITRTRQYKLRLNELESSLKFLQYGSQKLDDTQKALDDIRKLIMRKEEKKIMLWDPYLSSEDILNTLYFTQYYGTEMRAITSCNSDTRNINGPSCANVNDWMKEQRDILTNRSNNYGINLEVRCQHDNYGWGFHDRFILFIDRNNTASVWSLGTSINSLGKKHHIILEVSHPQHIVDAFESLWVVLDNSDCLLWRG